MKKFIKILKSSLRWIIPTIIIVLLSLYFIQKRKEARNRADKTVEFKTDESKFINPVIVEARPAFVGDLIIRVSASGVARPWSEVTIIPRVSGRIVELPVQEGSEVKEGEMIFKIDDSRYRLDLEEAENNLKKAQASFVEKLFSGGTLSLMPSDTDSNRSDPVYLEKMRQSYENAMALKEAGKISEKEFSKFKIWYDVTKDFVAQSRIDRFSIRSGLDDAVISLRRARFNLLNTEIRAPFSGILGDQQVFLGQYVNSGRECFKLVDLSKIRIEANVLESEIGSIMVGREATAEFLAFPGDTFRGEVISINPIIDQEKRMCRVTICIDNPGYRIKSGMSADVKIVAKIYKERFLVPKEAVVLRDQREVVFIVRDGKAKWSYVTTGLENEMYKEVLSSKFNLKPGELVVTKGNYTLAHDAPVKVRK